jgi:hypothetical protein
LVKAVSSAVSNSSAITIYNFKNFENAQVLVTLSGSYSISVIAN